MLNLIAYGLLFLVAFVYALDTYFRRPTHLQEPPFVRSKLPLFGHLIGLGLYGTQYYADISVGQPELFTISILGFRLYIINSRHLIPTVQKHAKTISFAPFIKLVAKTWIDSSQHYLDLHDEPHSHLPDMGRAMRQALTPGKGLDYQNLRTGVSLQEGVEMLVDESGPKGKRVELYGWAKHVVSLAASEGIYGTTNPFRDPELEDAYWLWVEGIHKQMKQIPNIFLRKEIQAKDVVFEAFRKYWKEDHSDASDVIHAREKLFIRDEVNLEDQARTQASFNTALLGNTVPTSFWTLYDIISRPDLLTEIRAELEAHAVVKKNKGTEFALNVSALRTSCPLLLASYQESQRTRTVHASIRQITADTVIESPTTKKSYHLCAKQYLQIPSMSVHRAPDVWGSTATKFDPHRFIKDNAPVPKSDLPSSYAFMAWGAAPHVCPARQFASTEVLIFIALCVLRCEFTPEGKTWVEPKQKIGEFVTLMPPKGEVFVNVKMREGYVGRWELDIGESKGSRLALASG